jgi:K+-sensing histidine kinase KdpD
VKYTFNGQVSVFVEQSYNHEEIKVIVKDSGKGIDKLSRIGEWFGNLDIVENVNQNGIGFGITISKKLIEKLGGTISFQNVINNN